MSSIGAAQHLHPALPEGRDQRARLRVLLAQCLDRLRPRPAGIELGVPLLAADLGEEALHRGVVAGEQLAVEVARIPVDADAAEVEDDGLDRRGGACPIVARHGRAQGTRSSAGRTTRRRISNPSR